MKTMLDVNEGDASLEYYVRSGSYVIRKAKQPAIRPIKLGMQQI